MSENLAIIFTFILLVCLFLIHQTPSSPKKYPKIHFRRKISRSIECCQIGLNIEENLKNQRNPSIFEKFITQKKLFCTF